MVTIKRGLERKILIIGSAWNLITSLLTIFSYYSWFDQEGAKRLENQDWNTMIAGSQMVNNVLQVILMFGIFMLVGAIVTFLIAVKLKDNEIQYGVIVWIAIWGLIQLVSMDILGFILFLIAFVIYLAKNRAVRLIKNGETASPVGH
ncbi:hypothetical protein AJ85_07540 [Alkalihalobacillus alcalophilus ATCC 27647 = CGMCC 1.3604]|uniref:DUF4064 domain-containing protein n=1 Tax=Alkalihalobacillus alcalophilus ATCC 27647 = CGMCC 1.3604 TaxID=1218173 RepID=A0A094WNS2_ALKAL|nr:DUF4064 domain-containing protein [Alkalihalobacillus alcalophilus]KGA98496.1 hypothetical protein BALCAV_0203835 [Alkalihalobacillus alcalophilus ATCC 27647 = CGMCC 1.3604]MED1563736.1 DUF4064 domain-containing protein [Alkalihalobacillus alcalophilus]THG91042.1 hypothetical protein AJ85_07540 [Alkalihalobacillus alcalophilus ATCC 27647 = CGMCC 1.3604]